MSEANELRNPTKQPPADKGVTDILGDAVHSALYTAVQEPISGITQIVDQVAGTKLLPKVQFLDAPVAAKFGTADWHAQTVGSAVGMLLPFMLVGKGVKGALGTSTMTAETAGLMSTKAAFGMSMTEAGLTGFAYDALLRPSDTSHTNGLGGFLMDRGAHGLVGAGTFMTLTGSSLGLRSLAGSSAAIERSALVPLLKNPIVNGVLSGVPAGLFNAEAMSLVNTGKLASATELGQSVYGMSVIGGGFGAVHSFTAPRENGLPSRYDALKTQIQDGLSTGKPKLKEGLGLAGGDADGPDGIKHNVSPPVDGVVDPTKTEVVDPTKVVADPTKVVDDASKVVADPTKAAETPVAEDLNSGDLSAQLAALVDKFNAGKEVGTGAGKGRGSGRGKDKVVAPDVTETPEVVETPVVPDTTTVVDGGKGKGKGTLDMLPDNVERPPVIVNADLRDATTDSATRPEVTAETGTDATGAPKRRITIPEVETARHADLIEGAKELNNVLKTQDAAKLAEDRAILAEAKARDPLASATIVDAATQARQVADAAKLEAEQQRQKFTEYVEGKGQGLQTHLETVAEQLKYPEKALDLVRHDFAMKEGRDLLTTATADGATYEQQAAFDQFVRDKGQSIRPELERLGEQQKNSDIARALIERAYEPRQINVQVEDIGQQAAMNAGARILTTEGGIDTVALKKFAQDYGPAMEKHMLTAAEQLGYGVDAKIQIGEAYHGEAFRKGADLLRTNPLDVDAFKEFAQNEGKGLDKQMWQTAIDLGLDRNTQLAVFEAYRGVQSWVPVRDANGDIINQQKVDGTGKLEFDGDGKPVYETGKDGKPLPETVAVPPEKEAQFRMLVNVLEVVSRDPQSPASYIDAVRQALKSPDSEGLGESLDWYAARSGDGRLQALLREAKFPTENWEVSGKPDVIPLADLFPNTTEGQHAKVRVQDLNDLLAALKDAPPEQLAEKRFDVMDWLKRNSDPTADQIEMAAARRIGENTNSSRIAAVLDSFFGTDNLKSFEAAKAKYDAVAAEITPDMIARMQKSGADLFWDLAPPKPETDRMYGGSPRIDQSREAVTTRKLEDGSVVATFNPQRNAEGVVRITDEPSGQRTIEYADESKTILRPDGVNIEVRADGSWKASFSNGNYLIEYAKGEIDKVVYENGKATTVYRDGRIEHAGVENQTAWKNSDGTLPERQPVDATDTQATQSGPNVRSRAEVANLVEKLSSSDYNEASVAAINLKNSFGQMTDTQFVQWLNFAMGTHPDTFGGTGRNLPNWVDLHLRDGGQVLLQDSVQRMLRGGDTLAEQQSEAGQTRAFEARNIIRAYLNAPEGRPSTLQYPSWLVSGNQLGPESLPDNVRKDVRVRFEPDKLPPDVRQYLEQNPEKVQKQKEPEPGGRPARPPRDFTLPADTLPARLRTMSDVLQFAPKEIQSQLLKLGADDARALKDVMNVLTPPKSARDKAQPTEYQELLKLTVPQARDIYTVKLLIQAIRDANWAQQKNPAAYEANHALAMKAALQLLPDSPAEQGRVFDLVNGLSSGEIRAPWVDRDAEFEGPAKPGMGKHQGPIERQRDLRLDEEYPIEEGGEVYPQDEPPPDFYPDPLEQQGGKTPAGDFDMSDWTATREGDPAFDGIEDAADLNNAVDPGLIDGPHHEGDGL
ncbi:MAG: hypothetical protein JST89_09115 [Cyanobacteria bacterium SZAS-4]|nr:hypothetical protein [Cyanobacteria bacterium SZAS-4]